ARRVLAVEALADREPGGRAIEVERAVGLVGEESPARLGDEPEVAGGEAERAGGLGGAQRERVVGLAKGVEVRRAEGGDEGAGVPFEASVGGEAADALARRLRAGEALHGADGV